MNQPTDPPTPSQSNDPLAGLSDQVQASGAPEAISPSSNPYVSSTIPAAPQGNLGLSVIGAALGATGGAIIWAAIEYFSDFQFGYVAILVGLMAGGGAVLLGRHRSQTVGMIAAAAGLLGVLGGSYLSYCILLQSDGFREELRPAFEGYWKDERTAARESGEEWDNSPQAKEKAFDELMETIINSEDMNYINVIKEDPGAMGYMFLFGALGLYAAYRVGARKKTA